jgi:hypothetical protein
MERYIQTDIQSDMAFFFLRMRLLASPFGLAIIKLYNNKVKLNIQGPLLSRNYSQFTLFFMDFLVLKRDFSDTVQYPCKLFTFGLINSYFPIFTHKVQ